VGRWRKVGIKLELFVPIAELSRVVYWQKKSYSESSGAEL